MKRNSLGRRLAVERLESRDMLSVVPTGFTESQLAGGLTSPTSIAAGPDGHVFIAQQNGIIRLVHDNVLESEPFAALTVDSNGERGLTGITLDPDFSTNGYVYVYYTATEPSSHNRLSRLTAQGDHMLPGSEVILAELPEFNPLINPVWHMGGGIHINPIDGKLYLSVGQHQDTSTPQSLDSPYGKILRLNLDGSIPSDNPFYNVTTGFNRAIWALGLRNGFTTAIQPETGLMYINDVGEGGYEEIDQGAPGANFGWPTTEGPFDPLQYPNFTLPVYAYRHSEGCAIVGGVFYPQDNIQFPAQYSGKYFFQDFCSGKMSYFDPANPSVVSVFATGINFPTDLTVDSAGSLYYLTRGDATGGQAPGEGAVFKIAYTADVPPAINAQPHNALASVGYPASFTAGATGSSPLSYQWQRSEAGSGTWSDIDSATSTTFQLITTTLADDGDLFRLQVTNALGTATSNPATLSVTTNLPPVPTITLPGDGAKYNAGDTITFAGTATDNEDGSLGASAFTWQIDFHHDTHFHPFFPATSGITGSSFTIPVFGHTEPNVWYRIHLTVRDSIGLTTSTFRDVLPNKVNLTLAANIPGIQLDLDDQPKDTPYTFESVVGIQRPLAAPLAAIVGSQSYVFAGWSDGGAQSHSISTPSTNQTYTANYVPAVTTYLSDLPFVGTPSNGWGPVERDQSNGEQEASDGLTQQIRGTTYNKGLGVHSASQVTFNLGGAYTTFLSDIGIDDESAGSGSVVFQIIADGVTVYESGTIFGTTPIQSITLNVTGVQQLQLHVSPSTNGTDSDHADWANARLLVAAPATVTHLSDLPFVGTPTNGWGPVERDRSNGESGASDGLTQKIRGATYSKGLGVHASSQVTFNLGGAYTTFLSDIGVDDETLGSGSVAFQVVADGVTIYDSGTILGTSPIQSIALNVSGVQQLQLIVSPATNGVGDDHADWANARLLSYGSTALAPPSGLSAVALSSTEIRLNWKDNATTETGFEIDRSPDGTSGWTQVGTAGSNSTTFTDTGLTESTTYFYRVRAVNGATPSDNSNVASATTANQSTATYLSDLPFVGTPTNGWGPVERDRSNGESGASDGLTQKIRGATYSKGLGVHASSQVTFNLGGAYTTFLSDIGVDDETLGSGSVAFQVVADGVTIYDSGTILGTSPIQSIALNVSGVQQLQLIVSPATNGVGDDHADWANARLLSYGSTALAPPSGLSAVALSSTEIRLNWKDNATTETGFEIDRSPDGTSGWTQVGTAGSNSTTFTDTGLTESTTYFYRVRAVNGATPSDNSNVASATTANQSTATYLSDLPFVGTPTNGWGPVERDRSNGESGASDGLTQKIRGATYSKGLGVHASSQVTFNLGGAYTTFLSDIGVDDETLGSGSVAFQVVADGVTIYDSGTILGTSPIQSIALNVSEVQQLQLIVSPATNGVGDDHADWANARLLSYGSTAPPSMPSGLSGMDYVLWRKTVDQTGVVLPAGSDSSGGTGAGIGEDAEFTTGSAAPDSAATIESSSASTNGSPIGSGSFAFAPTDDAASRSSFNKQPNVFASAPLAASSANSNQLLLTLDHAIAELEYDSAPFHRSIDSSDAPGEQDSAASVDTSLAVALIDWDGTT